MGYKVFKYIIPTTPVTKKNSQRIFINRRTGKPFVMPSKAYEKYEAIAMMSLYPIPKSPIQSAVEVKAIFYMKTKRKVDLVNLLESLDDVLVKAGILADDNSDIVISHDGSRVMYDKENPRTEVTIKEVKE